MNFLRKTKNAIVANKTSLKLFIYLVNMPIIGGIYDFFYFNHIKKRMKDDDFELTIEPSNICNLKCIMCPYPKMKREKEIMWRRIIMW